MIESSSATGDSEVVTRVKVAIIGTGFGGLGRSISLVTTTTCRHSMVNGGET